MQQKQCKLISFQMYISNYPGIQFRARFLQAWVNYIAK